jgi:hypothetical protein
MKIECTENYNNNPLALKYGFYLACKLTENYSKVIDIVIPTFDDSHIALISFLGETAKGQLKKHREYKFRNITIKLHTNETLKKLHVSHTLLLLCTSNNLYKIVDFISPKICVVVPRQEENKKFWREMSENQ